MSMELELDRPFQRLVGQVLANRYQIESRIGEGAMGAVYRAKHVKVGRTFAVKVLHPRLLEDTKMMQRFEREAELAGRLRHPNVIGVVDVGETNEGLRYMVMDFAEGPDLGTLLTREAPLPPQRIIHITRQLLEGLFHAHEAGLIHRDFKPDNVIVEKDGHGAEVPRIVDFGIAILREGGDTASGPGRVTTNGLVLGTPHYMAPEQAVADPIDHRIDLFALGIVTYEMLCGKLPFDGSGAEVARANLLLDPPPISQRVPYLEVDPLLEAFARRLMAKKRDARPANGKVARDLLDLIARDRDAAAVALGVPDGGRREPAVTAPSAPVRRASGNETFPPPVDTSTTAQAHPMGAAMASTTKMPIKDTVEDTPTKRRTAMFATIGAGIAIAAGSVVVMLGGNDDKPVAKADPEVETIASAETPVEPQPTPVEVETVEAPKVEDAKVEIEKVDETKQAPTPPPTKATTKKTATKTAKVDVKPVETKPVETKPVETKPVETKPVETKPVETKPAAGNVDGNSLASQYKAVGAQLKALQEAKGADAVSDLWSRYRFIRLSDAMSTQSKRDQAAAILDKLATEAAARKK